MEKIFIKKQNKEVEVDSWNEANQIVLEVLSKYILDQKIGTKIIDSSITEDGFFIDFETKENISEKTLPLFEGKIRKILLKEVVTNSIIPSSMVKQLKFRGVSGLSLDGINGNRIFGFASLTKDEFSKKLSEITEREQRDHRKIGKDLDLFYFDDLSGKGMPIWLENGVLLKKQIRDYIQEQERRYGSKIIETPVIGSLEMYKTSGHFSLYKESMFPIMKNNEKEEFVLRPMACPHHILVFKRKPRSHKELPLKFYEDVKMFRYENSGALIGLERVRGMELTDSHIFLKEDQLEDELGKSVSLIKDTLSKFNIEIDYVELALHDPKNKDKYHGEKESWDKGENILRNYLSKNNINFIEKKGEAAFYGPKIDIQIKTALGHTITVSTIQLDFFLPSKFGLEYIDSDQIEKQPIMIHRGHIGTYERFISIILEQTKGDLPMWLAPQQAVIIPINNDAHFEYCEKVYNTLFDLGVRVKMDDSDERLSNKIRIHQERKVKTQIVIGDNEVKNNTISYRFFGSENAETIPLEDIMSIYKNENHNK